MADLIGQKLGQYEITAKLGSGGMATVYRARQESMGREVAIKVIEWRLAENPEFVKRFGREARTIAALNHPHILKVFDFGQEGDLLYLVMELQPGGSLADLIRSGPLSLEDAGRLLEQIASALDYAHEQGIIHRDLKPQNVLLDAKGNAILTDFGIAKVLTQTTALTASGAALGTPSYMSPEQWQGLPLDNRTDIYALGIMLFEMLSGKLPFNAETPFGMMHQHINQTPPLIRAYRPDLPSPVEAVINQALAKNPEQRFQSAEEMVRAFKSALIRTREPLGGRTMLASDVEPERGRSSRLPILGVMAAVALVLIGLLALVLSAGGQNPPLTPTGATGTGIAGAPTTLAAPASESPGTPAPAQTLPPSASPSLTPAPPTFTLTATLTVPPSPTLTATVTPTITPNLATRAAGTLALRETGTANAIASYTRTPTPNEERTLAAMVGATETARAIASYTRTPTATPIPPTLAPQTPHHVGLVVGSTGDPYDVTLLNGAGRAAKALGWNLEVQAPTNFGDMASLTDAVNTLLGKGVEALAIDPILFEGASDSARLALVKAINDKKVPLLSYSFTVPLASGGTVAAYIGFDQWAGAQKLAETTCDLVAGKYKTTPDKTQGKVFILLGTPGEQTQRRTGGFKAGLAAKCPGVQVVGEESAGWALDPAYQVAAAALKKMPDIDVFFGNNDQMAIGAGQAAEKSGRKLNVDVFAVGIDGTYLAFDMMSRGILPSAVLATFPDKTGELVIGQMAKILNGEQVPPLLLMPAVVVTQDNLSAYQNGKLWTEPVAARPETLSAQPPPTLAPPGGILTIWGVSGREARLRPVVDAFTARYRVKVDVQFMDWATLQNRLFTDGPMGKGPDIIDTTSDYLIQAYTKDVLAEIDLGDKAGDFDPVALQTFTHDGKLYGLPYSVNAVALFYNKDLVPTPPKTWDELKSIATKLQNDKKVDQGVAFLFAPDDGYSTYPLLSGFGGYAFGRDANGNYDLTNVGIDSPGSIRGAAELDSMVKAGLLRGNLDYGTAQGMFVKGRLAMWVSGPWELGNMRASGIRYGVVLIPPMARAARPLVSSDGFVLSKFSGNPQLARLFLTEFMASPDPMKMLYDAQSMAPAYLPTRRQVDNPDLEVFLASAAIGDPIPVIPAWDSYMAAVSNAIGVIYQQKDTPENAMKRAANAVREKTGGVNAAQPTPTFALQGGALTIWASTGREGCIQAASRQFENEFGVKVSVQVVDWGAVQSKFVSDASAGPDLLALSSDQIGYSYSQGLLAEIALGDKAGDFDPVALQTFTHGGKLFGVPYDFAAVVLYYNKDLVPTPPRTWDELKAMAQKLQDAKKVQQGFAFMAAGDIYGTYPLLSGFGGYIFGRDKNGDFDPNQVGIDSPGAIRAAAELDSMIKAGLLRSNMDYGTAQDMFRQGQLAMWVSGPWALNYFGTDVRYGITLIPPMTQAARPLVNSDGFVLNRMSKNVPLAQQFLTEFLPRTDVMKTFYEAKCLIPTYLPLLREIADPDMAVFQAAADSGDIMPGISALQAFWDNVSNAVAVIYAQKDTPENIMRGAANAMRRQIAGLGK